MSLSIVDTDGILTIHDKTVALRATSTITIPALCCGTIPHKMELRRNGRVVLLVAAAGVFMTRSLLVDACLVDDGELFTHVFNLSKRNVKVRKGEVISYLVEVM